VVLDAATHSQAAQPMAGPASVVEPLTCGLSTASGLGDRLLDAFAACAVAQTLSRPLRLHIPTEGLAFQGFIGDYDWDSIELPNCTVLDGSKKLFSFQTGSRAYFGVRGNRLVLRHEQRWATTTLRELCRDKSEYFPRASDEEIRAAYLQVVKGTRVRSGKSLPKGHYVGFHVRRKDKVVEKSISYHDMSPEIAAKIEERALAFAKELVARGQKYIFLCGDDPKYNKTFAPKLRETGAEVLLSDYSAVEDHACLQCCTLIVQCTLYSTFSITAAMIAQVPLVNFTESPKTMLGEWLADEIIALEDSGPPIALPRVETGPPTEWALIDSIAAVGRGLIDAICESMLKPETMQAKFEQVYAADAIFLPAPNMGAGKGWEEPATLTYDEQLKRLSGQVQVFTFLGAEVESIAATPARDGRFEVWAKIDFAYEHKDQGGRDRHAFWLKHLTVDMASRKVVRDEEFTPM